MSIMTFSNEGFAVGAESSGAKLSGAEPLGAESPGAEPLGAELSGAEPLGAESPGAESSLFSIVADVKKSNEGFDPTIQNFRS
jgi:hypothetical protein